MDRNRFRMLRRMGYISLMTVLVLASGLVGAAPVAADANPPAVQFFFVPMPEDQLLTVLKAIDNGAGGQTYSPRDPVETYISIAVAADGTLVYYDQWENGYDDDIANPANLYSVGNPGGTQIWGDGDLSNGAPPGIPSDILNAGTVISLKNVVQSTTRASVIDFDGGDKIAATKPIAVTRAGWASNSKTMLAGANEVYDVDNWGVEYRIPVGPTTPDSQSMFEYTGAMIMAGPGGASVQIDADANGSYETTVVLGEGQSHLINSGLTVGARILANNPVQVDLLTGDINALFESRFYRLKPVELWHSDYVTPVSTRSADATSVFLYNPGSTAITVTRVRRSSDWPYDLVSTSRTVPAGGNYKEVLPDGTGARFYATSGAKFYALSATDSDDGESGNQAYDWGFSLIPVSHLAPQALVGMGIGRDYTSAVNPNENASPVWVTPVGNGNTAVTIYVDYDADPNTGALTDPNGYKYDVALSLRELERAKVYNPAGDQTRMLLYTLASGVKLAVAWGSEPGVASPSEPGLDMGTGVPPLPNFDVAKLVSLYADNDEDGYPSPGDELLYTILIQNTGRAPVFDILLKDTLSSDTTYVPNSTYWQIGSGTPTQIPDQGAPSTPFPLDMGGYVLAGSLPVGGSYTITFRVTINASPSSDQIVNKGSATAAGNTLPFQAIISLRGRLGDRVWFDANQNGIQDEGEIGLSGILVKLNGPGGLYQEQSTDGNGKYVFSNLLPGNYTVQFVAPVHPVQGCYWLFTWQHQGGDPALDSNANADGLAQPSPIALGPGEVNLTIDAGLIVRCTDPSNVELSEFTVTREGDTFRIKWSTATEFDTVGFDIYALQPDSDTLLWITESTIPPKGLGAEPQEYYLQAERPDLEVGAMFYLRAYDTQGGYDDYGPVEAIYVAGMPRPEPDPEPKHEFKFFFWMPMLVR